MNEKGEIRIKEEKSRLPVDVRGSKTCVLKLPINVVYTQTLHEHYVSSQANCSFYSCSRGYVVPLFYSKKRELITRDNPFNQSINQIYLNTVNGSASWFSDMPCDNYNLFAKGAQVLNAGPRGGGTPIWNRRGWSSEILN